jgi:hypothetical protein
MIMMFHRSPRRLALLAASALLLAAGLAVAFV